MSVRTTNRATAAQLMHGGGGNVGAPYGGGFSDMKSMGNALDISEVGAMEGQAMRATQPDEPIIRTLNVSVRGNLSDMTSNPSLSVWQPTQEALAAMFQKAKYTNLKGNMENKGDLKSVILHSVSVKAVQSDFPFAIGAKITGVDESTFTRSGKAYSAVFMPKESSHAHRVLQKDNVEVAYDFASRYPGYTVENLGTQGVHKVMDKQFVLISGDHPLVQAIRDNQEQLQMASIESMPENMVKVSAQVYNAIFPLVQEQVANQIKVTDLGGMKVQLEPAEFASWTQAMDATTVTQSHALTEERKRALGACTDDKGREQVTRHFEERINKMEAGVQKGPLEINMQFEVAYNFL